jgi:hypothetical protein
VARLLAGARNPKHRAALAVAYGAGLRASEVVGLKVSDVDSQRMTLRIEQGKGRKDRYALLSPVLLEALRTWWRAARAQGTQLRGGWLFPGMDPTDPMTTRQLNRVVHQAATTAGIDKRVSMHTLRHSFATHLLEQKVDIRLIQVLLGHKKIETTVLYTQVATETLREVVSPLECLPAPSGRGRGPAGPGGGRCLPRAWCGLAPGAARPPERGPAEGDVSHRALPQRCAGRACPALRRLRARPDRLQLLPQPALPQVPGTGGAPLAGCARRRSAAGGVLPRGVHAARADRRTGLPEQGAAVRAAV